MKEKSGPILVSAVLFVTAFLLAFYLPKSVRDAEVREWSKPLEPEMQRALTTNVLAALEGSEIQKSRLVEQTGDIIGRAEHHWKVMAYFQSNYYVGILLRNIFAGLAAIAIFLVARKGWELAGPLLISFALTTSVCAMFFTAFPLMFKQEENFGKNKALYLRYVALLNEIHTYVATGHHPQRNSKAADEKRAEAKDGSPLAAFIVHLNDELATANDIAIAFDPNKGAIYKFSTDK